MVRGYSKARIDIRPVRSLLRRHGGMSFLWVLCALPAVDHSRQNRWDVPRLRSRLGRDVGRSRRDAGEHPTEMGGGTVPAWRPVRGRRTELVYRRLSSGAG